jgi:hypothetical protein
VYILYKILQPSEDFEKRLTLCEGMFLSSSLMSLRFSQTFKVIAKMKLMPEASQADLASRKPMKESSTRNKSFMLFSLAISITESGPELLDVLSGAIESIDLPME